MYVLDYLAEERGGVSSAQSGYEQISWYQHSLGYTRGPSKDLLLRKWAKSHDHAAVSLRPKLFAEA